MDGALGALLRVLFDYEYNSLCVEEIIYIVFNINNFRIDRNLKRYYSNSFATRR